mgnify:CR=1 FL=1
MVDGSLPVVAVVGDDVQLGSPLALAQLVEGGVGGGEDTCIDGDVRVASNAAYLFLLQHAQ